jgi:hypothetical protein
MTAKFDCRDNVTDHESVEQFVERLATFSRMDWLSVAAAVAGTASSRAEATEALDRVIAHHGLAFDAWSIGDDVETAFHYSMGATGVTSSPRDCALLRIAREAAAKAGVALFVGSLLSAADFEMVYRPFTSLVPQTTRGNSRRPAAARPPIKLVAPSPREWRRGTA